MTDVPAARPTFEPMESSIPMSRLSYAIALLIGPKDVEVARTEELLDAIGALEPTPADVVVIDDAPQPRDLQSRLKFPPQLTPTFLKFDRPKVGFKEAKGVAGNSMMAFQWIARHAPQARFGMKIDTDALVIGPFAQKLAAEFDRDPTIGALGAYTKTPEGLERDIARNARLMRELHRPPVGWNGGPRGFLRSLKKRFGGSGGAATIRRHISDAVANGYVYGENCLGGAYAMSRESFADMKSRGYLDDYKLWTPVDVPEEVMMCMYVRATGRRLENFVDRGQVFGVRFVGLPFGLEEIVERGYSIIHSIKNDKRHSEEEIVQFFREQRKTQPRSG
jgi:hypothetical protein